MQDERHSLQHLPLEATLMWSASCLRQAPVANLRLFDIFRPKLVLQRGFFRYSSLPPLHKYKEHSSSGSDGQRPDAEPGAGPCRPHVPRSSAIPRGPGGFPYCECWNQYHSSTLELKCSYQLLVMQATCSLWRQAALPAHKQHMFDVLGQYFADPRSVFIAETTGLH